MRFVQLSVRSLALVLGLALLAPTSAFGQNNIKQLGLAVHNIPATGDQQLRVTAGNPSAGGAIDGSGEIVIIVAAGPGGTGHVRRTLDPGASFTYTLDPRTVGQLIDPRWDVYHVPVRVWVEAQVVDGRPAPQPSITIEVVRARTGVVQSVHIAPGFAGGVPVAAADPE
jgi:hypothetical protein